MQIERHWDSQQVFASRGVERALTISYGEKRKAHRDRSLDDIQPMQLPGFTIKVTAYGIRYDAICHIEKTHIAFQHALREAVWEQKQLLQAGLQEALDLPDPEDPESGN